METCHFYLSTSVPERSRGQWGDTLFARQLGGALVAAGARVTHVPLFGQIRPSVPGGHREAVIRVSGPHLEDPVPGMVNVAYVISHGELTFPDLLAAYDLVLIASRRLAVLLRERGVNAHYMPQATDCGWFHPDRAPEPDPPYQIAFVGNHNLARGSRDLVLAAARMGLPLSVWGHGWEGAIPARNWIGAHLDAEALARVYAGSRIVLNTHMGHMAALGMMSNRSYDAIAAGAAVISDPVAGFAEGSLPGLHIARDAEELRRIATDLLARPPAPREARLAQNAAVAALAGFDILARRIAGEIRDIAPRPPLQAVPSLPRGAADDGSFRGGDAIFVASPLAAERLAERLGGGSPAGLAVIRKPGDLDGLPPDRPALLMHPDLIGLWSEGERLHLLTSLPGAVAEAPLPATQGFHDHAATLNRTLRAVGHPGCRVHPPGMAPPPLAEVWAGLSATAGKSPVHPTDCDGHLLLAAVMAGDPVPPDIRARGLALQRRLRMWHLDGAGRPVSGLCPEGLLARIWEGTTLFVSAAADQDRDRIKQHVILEPLPVPPPPPVPAQAAGPRPVGVFLHLFYDELAPVFADRLRHIGGPAAIHISTDTPAKADRIRPHFPGADIRIAVNRGRDIWPKLWLFADAYDRHDIVLHLHGKRSEHSGKLQDWLQHVLDSLLPSRARVNRILSLFADIPHLGLVAPSVFRPVLPSVHWTLNYRTACELARRLGQPAPPDNAGLLFPAGSMFWARTQALRPLIDLGLTPDDFPPEAGQVDGTLAHAVERMIGVTCAAQGLAQVFVAPPQYKEFRKFGQKIDSSAALAEWIAQNAQTMGP